MTKKLSDFVTKNENGEFVFDEAAYAAEMDRVRNEASNTARTNAEKTLKKEIEASVRQEIEDAAKLSAEEKLAKEKAQLDEARKAFNAERFKAHIKAADLFSDEETEVYMGLLGDDYEASIAGIDRIIDARKKYNETYESKVKEQIQLGTPRVQGGTASDQATDSVAVRMAKKFNEAAQNANKPVVLGGKTDVKVEI